MVTVVSHRALGFSLLALLLPCLMAPGVRAADPAAWFAITTVDAAGAPVPGTRLMTTNGIELISDNAGNIAFYEPQLMGVEVYFSVVRAGFAVPEDGFGFRGARLTTTPGTTATIVLEPDGADPFGADADWGDAMSQRLAGPVPGPSERFGVRVVDAATGEGVPLVRLGSVGVAPPLVADVAGVYWTDSGGWMAWHEPGHMDEALDFRVTSDGYRLTGGAGDVVHLKTTPGATAIIEVERLLPAERLVRMTGQGIHRDAILLGKRAEEPLAGRVMGQDSVWTAEYGGKLFWLWGDTARPEYPLGNFATSSATSVLAAAPGPGEEVALDYFVDETGFSKKMAEVEGPGVTWLSELVVVAGAAGERLIARYGKYLSLGPPAEIGLVVFNDALEVFEPLVTYALDAPVTPHGSPTMWTFGADDTSWALFSKGVRVRAEEAAFADPTTYEAWSPYTDAGRSGVEHDEAGRPVYRWVGEGIPPARAAADEGETIAAEDALEGHERDIETGREFRTHDNDAVAYNPWRRRFVRIAEEVFGESSILGELWAFEADTPLGPWVHGRHVITHDDYTFYNARLHPYFETSEEPGRVVLFEGTYTRSFTEREAGTPRYDYNQMLYRLDLADARMNLPVAVYTRENAEVPVARVDLGLAGDTNASVRRLFYVADRPGPELVPIGWSAASCEQARSLVAGEGVLDTLGYGRPLTGGELSPPAGMTTLWTWRGDDDVVQARAGEAGPAGAQAVAYVWPNVTRGVAPVIDLLPPLRAHAGADRCAGEGESVLLDAGASTGAGADGVSWRVGDEVFEGLQATLTLPPGVHEAVLTVRDTHGATATDRAWVVVRATSTPPDPDSDDLADHPTTGSGCGGCAGGQSTPWPPALLLALLLLYANTRRRRRCGQEPTGQAVCEVDTSAPDPFTSTSRLSS